MPTNVTELTPPAAPGNCVAAAMVSLGVITTIITILLIIYILWPLILIQTEGVIRLAAYNAVQHLQVNQMSAWNKSPFKKFFR